MFLRERSRAMETLPRWRHAEISQCWCWFTDGFSDVAQDILRTCFSPLRRWSLRNTANISVRTEVPAICRCLARSALGLTDVYNLLPARVVGTEERSIYAA